MKKMIYAIGILLVLLFLLSSCHKNYVYLLKDVKLARYNQDSSKFAFIMNYAIKKPPTYLASIPDGGTPKVIFDKTYVYLFDIKKTKPLWTKSP